MKRGRPTNEISRSRSCLAEKDLDSKEKKKRDVSSAEFYINDAIMKSKQKYEKSMKRKQDKLKT